VEEVLLVDNITTERTWISTIQVTSEKSVCDTSTSKATTSGSQLSTSTRYVNLSASDFRRIGRDVEGGRRSKDEGRVEEWEWHDGKCGNDRRTRLMGQLLTWWNY
jgi:hypothetical protein